MQGGGLFRSGANGDISNVFFSNNNGALSGGGLFEVPCWQQFLAASHGGNSTPPGCCTTDLSGQHTDMGLANGQVASIGDVSNCTFLSNAAGTDGPAVYAFNCAGRIFNNAFANEPVNAVRGLHSSVVCSLRQGFHDCCNASLMLPCIIGGTPVTPRQMAWLSHPRHLAPVSEPATAACQPYYRRL